MLKKNHTKKTKPEKKERKKEAEAIDIKSIKSALHVFYRTFPLLVFSFLLFFSGFFGVSEIEVKGDTKITEDEIYDTLYPFLNARVLLFFKRKNNLLFIEEKKLEKSLKEKFKFLETADAKIVFPNKLEVALKKSKPALALKFSSGEYLTVTKNGFPLEEIKEDMAYTIKVPVIEINEKRTETDIFESERIVHPDFSSFVEELKDISEKRLNLRIEKIVFNLKSKGRIVTAQYENGLLVKYNIVKPSRESIETLAKILPLIDVESTKTVDLSLDGTYFVTCKKIPCIL